jgi:hypothetical protein
VTRSNQFQRTLFELQRSLGQSVLFPLSRLAEREAIPTGFPDIDQLLGGQGIRSGQVTAFCGKPSSGVTSFTYSLMAQAQHQNRNVVTMDLGETFDAHSAMQWGVISEQIFTVRAHEARASVEIVRTLIKNGIKLLVVLDTTDMRHSFNFLELLRPILGQIKPELAKSNSAILVLLAKVPGQPIQADYETVLKLEHRDWIKHDDDIRGYRVRATLLKDGKISGEPTALVDIMLKDGSL